MKRKVEKGSRICKEKKIDNHPLIKYEGNDPVANSMIKIWTDIEYGSRFLLKFNSKL